MVQVEPVVQQELIFQDFPIVQGNIGDFGIGEHHGNRVVPWLVFFGGVNRDPWCLFQDNRFLVPGRTAYIVQDLPGLTIGKDLKRYPPNLAFLPDAFPVGQQEGSAPVIQQPLYFLLFAQDPKGNPISFKVVFLPFGIHRDQDGGGESRQTQDTDEKD